MKTLKRAHLIALALVLALVPSLGADTALTREQMEVFLTKAKIVGAQPIGKGVTRPWRLTLTDGTLTHDAAFQSVDEKRAVQDFAKGKKTELNFVDSWRYNVAAYRLAPLVGISDMIPVSVERRWNGKDGALTWWVDEVLMDEEARRKKNVLPPDPEPWSRDNHRMRVFTALVHDTDRNQGNILITPVWKIVMIDFTRAFRQWEEVPAIQALIRCDRAMLEAMRALTEDGIKKAVGHYLTSFEARAILKRRDQIVEHVDNMVKKRGETAVLF
jgi:hypothetical protein